MKENRRKSLNVPDAMPSLPMKRDGTGNRTGISVNPDAPAMRRTDLPEHIAPIIKRTLSGYSRILREQGFEV
jgi:hypothetical protein